MRAPTYDAGLVESSLSPAILQTAWSTLSDQSSEAEKTLAGNNLACVSKEGSSTRSYRLRVALAMVLQSIEFEWATVGLVVLNTAMIGIEQCTRLNGHNYSVFAVIETVFLCYFSLEILARLVAFGPGCLKSSWIVFDFLLVGISLAANWIFPLFEDSMSEDFSFFMVMRTVRLLRLGRTLRLLIHFKELWMLVRGLLGSACTIMYTLTILAVVIFVFSSLGIELITNNPKADPTSGDQEFARVVEEHFNSLELTMLTLIQFATLDSVAVIYAPLIKKEPYLVLYFAGLIVVLGIVLMNLITAVVVQSALEQAMQDKQIVALELRKKKARCIRDVSALFKRIDADHSGYITRDEFSALMSADTEDRAMLLQILSVEDPEAIFDALDVSGDGEVSIDEFCDVLWAASNQQGSIDLMRAEKKIDRLQTLVEESMALPRKVSSKKSVRDRLPGGVSPCDTVRPARGRQTRELPPRDQLHVHQEVVTTTSDPTWSRMYSAHTSGDTEHASECGTASMASMASPRQSKANARTHSEPSRQRREVPDPPWASSMKQALIEELQATRQMLIQEVHHACHGVHEATRPEPPSEPVVPDPAAEPAVPLGVPHDDHHCVPAACAKRFTGAPSRRPPPQAPAAWQPGRPGCLLKDVATTEPSTWRSCPLPDPTTHIDERQKPP